VDEGKNITQTELLPSPDGCGCKSDIAAVLQEKGVTVMLAGNMGTGAVNVLARSGIEVYRGCSGDVRAVAEAFLAGAVSDSGQSCMQHENHHGRGHSHEHGHQCNH
jgi:predicted Fe-Mo cluster-binding NifX family protein